MRCRRFVSTIALAMVCGAGVLAQESRPSADGVSVSYEAFMQRDVEQRRALFASITPENKATLKRTHAERWLAANRERLTASQIAAVQEATAFLSPELYRNPSDPGMRKRESEVRSRIECSLSRQDALDAFTFLGPTPKPTWTETLDSWLAWFTECLALRW